MDMADKFGQHYRSYSFKRWGGMACHSAYTEKFTTYFVEECLIIFELQKLCCSQFKGF
jgi:hypothetical protein